MPGPNLWLQSTTDRYIICVTAADTQLTLESNPAVRWRLYGDSVESVSETLRRIESRDTTRHATHDTTSNTTLGPATETGDVRG